MNSVNDILNNVPQNNFLIFKSIKEKFSTHLVPLQKKVVIVAIAVFSCYALVCLSFRSCFKKMGKVCLKKVEKPIVDRLADNCKDAIDQQEAERARDFNVNCPTTPTGISLRKGWMPIHGKSETINGRLIGTAFSQGARQAMEDADIAETGILTIKEHAYPFELFGVFDGHGGSDVSNFVKERIQKYLIKELEDNNPTSLTDEGIFIALKKCFKKLDADYQGSGGTTATVAFIIKNEIKDEIWVANVGDSRTILVRADGATTQASEDAKPEMDSYAKKIKDLGGWLVELEDTWRVNGRLAVARAIGDKNIKGKGIWGQCCVSPSPKITRFDLNAFKGGHLVLACDGLYDVASTNEVGDAIHQLAQENELSDNAKNLEEMGRKLIYQAIYNGSKDNVTVMIVKL